MLYKYEMANKLDIKKTLLYTIFITPLIILLLELSLQILYRYRFDNNEYSFLIDSDNRISKTKFDPITGWSHNCDFSMNQQNFPNQVICNRHGLVKTPFSVKDSNEDVKGVLLLGNSVAMGEGLYSRGNRNSFASQVELHLRELNSNIDLVNGAYSGFNTWQEHLEAVRYFNSEPLFDDLPRLEMIVSFGGIQDFWNFLRLLVNNELNTVNDYKIANGLMININTIDYINTVTSSYSGNIYNGFKALLASISLNSRLYALTTNLLNNFFTQQLSSIDKNQAIIGITPRISYQNLDAIIINRFGLTKKEYLFIRDYFISSVTRNIKANSVLLEKGNYVYTYAPTYFSTLDNNSSLSKESNLVKGIGHLIGNKEYQFDIYENELNIIEKDYRTALIEKLKSSKEIQVLDYSQLARDVDWFIDYSHLNEYAASSLGKRLANDLIILLDRKSN